MVTNVEAIYNNELKLDYFPNPAREQVLVHFNKMIQNGKLTVYDMSGRNVISQTLSTRNNIIIEVSALEMGIYFLEIKEGERRFYGKLVVEK
jgi:hypothetical protein